MNFKKWLQEVISIAEPPPTIPTDKQDYIVQGAFPTGTVPKPPPKMLAARTLLRRHGKPITGMSTVRLLSKPAD